LHVSNSLDQHVYIKISIQVIWSEGGSQPADYHTFLRGNMNTSYHLGTDFFVHQRIKSAVKKADLLVTGCHV